MHSIRNTKYGIQLARDGKISNLQCAIDDYNRILEEEATDWKYYQDKYGPLGRELHLEFSALVPPKELTANRQAKKDKLREKTQEKRKLRVQERENRSNPTGASSSIGN